MKPVIVIGAGAHAVVVLDILNLMNREIRAICDPKLKEGESYCGISVVLEDSIEKYSPLEFELVNSIGSVKSLDLRKNIFRKYKGLGFNFASLIHPSAILAKNHQFGEGIQIMARVVIQPGVVLGDNTIINTGAIIEHDCQIGRSVHVAPGALLCGSVGVGEGTHIGAGAVVIQNVLIGDNVLVGANCTVLSNVDDNQKIITRIPK